MATLVVFGSLGLARFGYSVVLAPMQVSLSMDNGQAGMLATVNLAGYLLLSVLGGALAARFGPRAVIATGLAVAGAGMALTGLAESFLSAAVWRGLTGVGSGASNVPVMGLLAAWFGRQRRGLASGIGVAGSSLALISLGPLVPRVISAAGAEGWRLCWHLFAAATLLLAACGWCVLRNRPAEKGLEPLGADEGGAGASAAAGGLHWGRVYRSGIVWLLGLVYVAYGFSYIIYMTFFVKYLVAEVRFSSYEAGTLFMTMGWCSLLCGLIWGSVSDRLGRRAALIMVYLIQATAFALFALWPARAGLTLSAVLFGFTAWSIPAIMAAACGDVLGPRLAPAALGFVTLFFGIGQALGPSVAGAMADAAQSFAPVFVMAAGISLLGALMSLKLRLTPAGADRP